MKTLITIVVMCLTLSTTQAQTVQKLFAEQIVAVFNGTTITKITDVTEITEENLELIVAELPAFYDDELVEITIRKITQNYSDIFIYEPWKIDEDWASIGLIVVEKIVIINYYSNKNILIIAYP